MDIGVCGTRGRAIVNSLESINRVQRGPGTEEREGISEFFPNIPGHTREAALQISIPVYPPTACPPALSQSVQESTEPQNPRVGGEMGDQLF